MRPEDVIIGGFLPLQDHDAAQELHGRMVPMAFRNERTSEAGDPVPEGHGRPDGEGDEVSTAPIKTGGDVHGGFVWPVESLGKRPIPMWGFARAAVTTEPSRDLRPPAVIVERVGSTSTVRGAVPPPSTVAADPAKQRVRVRPVGDAGFAPDDRFRALDAALAPSSPALPKGYPGLVVVTTQERKQVELFLPSGGAPLIAVDHAGPPSLASLVSDLTPAGELDLERQARLHTHVRVVRLGPSCTGLPANNALAWQLKPATQDGFSGGGLVVDFAAASSTPAATAPPSTPTGGSSPTVGRTATSGGTQIGGVTNTSTAVTPDSHNGQSGGVVFIGPDGKPRRATTVTRPPAPTNPTQTRDPAPAGGPPRVIVAACSSKHGGMLEVGRVDDVHQIGVTKDGEPINSGHLPTGSLFLAPDGPGDGPLDFDTKTPYSKGNQYPFSSEVVLRWDASATHDHPCGPKAGRWRWLAGTPFYIPDPPKKPPRLPPPPEGPKTHNRVINEFTPLPPRSAKPGAVATGTGVPLNKPEPAPVPPAIPTAATAIRFGGGVLIRPVATATGTPNVSGTGGLPGSIDAKTCAGLDRAPDTVQIHGFAPGNGTVDGWTGVTTKPDGTRVATGGGMVVIPAGASLPAVLDGTSTCAEKANVYMPPCHAQTAYATPDATTGSYKSGFGIGAVAGGGTLTTIHKGAGGATGYGTQQTSAGDFSTINAAGTPQATLKGAGGVTMIEQSAPATPASGYMEWYPKSDGKPYVKNDAGTETDLTATGGGGAVVGGSPMGYDHSSYAYQSYSGGSIIIRNAMWGPWGPCTLGANFGFYDPNSIDTTASGGRTFTFANASWTDTNYSPLGNRGTLTASSGSFVTDGWAAGDLIWITGTTSNNLTVAGIIDTVTATVLTYRTTMGFVPTAEGPLSATARIRRFAVGVSRQAVGSVMRDHFQWTQAGDDGSAYLWWDAGGVVLPDDFTAFTNGIMIDTKLNVVSGGSWGSGTEVDLIVFDPSDGTTEIVATRTVTADDSAYATLTLAPGDLTDFGPGDTLRMALRVLDVASDGDSYNVKIHNLRYS